MIAAIPRTAAWVVSSARASAGGASSRESSESGSTIRLLLQSAVATTSSTTIRPATAAARRRTDSVISLADDCRESTGAGAPGFPYLTSILITSVSTCEGFARFGRRVIPGSCGGEEIFTWESAGPAASEARDGPGAVARCQKLLACWGAGCALRELTATWRRRGARRRAAAVGRRGRRGARRRCRRRPVHGARTLAHRAALVGVRASRSETGEQSNRTKSG